MKNFPVTYLKSAQKDLLEIFEYIAADKPDAAGSHLEKLDRTISLLQKNPELGIIPKENGLRKKGYRILIFEAYLIFYVVKKNKIQVRRVLHGTRQYQFLL